MREFIDFHLRQGVTRFYIYDNDSSDDIGDLLKPYIDDGVVEYRVISGKARQLDAYNDAIRRHRNDGYLIAVVDADEFLVPADCEITVLDELRALAHACPPAGAFGINWKIFGSSGYKAKSECPSPYVTKSFLRRAKDDFETNRHVKSIVDPRAVLAFLNPHAPVLLPGAHEYSNSGEQISGPYCNQSYRFISLHHYFCKSYEEFCIKRGRGKADLLETRPFEDFDRHDKNDVYDDSAATVL